MPLRLTFLGGLEAIGTSCLLVDDGTDAFLVDCGKAVGADGLDAYPDLDSPGAATGRLRALFLSHAHDDHVGGLPHFAARFPAVPVFATRETFALVRRRLPGFDESAWRVLEGAAAHSIGQVTVMPFAAAHSAPGTVGFRLFCADGTLVVMPDYCLDAGGTNGAGDGAPDLAALAAGGPVDLLVLESTNAQLPSRSVHEPDVARELAARFAAAPGRVFATCFSSQLARLAGLVEAAVAAGLPVHVEGQAFTAACAAGKDLGWPVFQAAPFPGFFEHRPTGKRLVLVSGSQGEPDGALARLAGLDELRADDTILVSASAVPGNEDRVRALLDRLASTPARVFAPPAYGLHASGHASRAEHRQVLAALRPRAVVPCHGSMLQRRALAELAGETVPAATALLPVTGQGIVLERGQASLAEAPPAPAAAKPDPQAAERANLAARGVAFVNLVRQGRTIGPVSLTVRGFARADELGVFLEEARALLEGEAENLLAEGKGSNKELRELLAAEAERLFKKRFGRSPWVLANVSEWG